MVWVRRQLGGERGGLAGKAYFLAESCIAVLGRQHTENDKKGILPGDTIDIDPKKGGNPTKAFEHFWEQIQQAYNSTKDQRLKVLLEFKAAYLINPEGKINSDMPFLELRKNKKKEDKQELVVKIGEEDVLPLKGTTLGFSIEGQPLTMEDENDPLREYWFDRYLQDFFQDDSKEYTCDVAEKAQKMVCLVTGQVGKPIARSHKPKILGVPGLSSGGYIVSFAKEAPAFSSYGLEMGQNAPVSEQAAAAYTLAINKLLADDDTHLKVGPISVCFWARTVRQAPGQFRLMLGKAYPEQVGEFLRAPFAGIADREVLRRDRLYTVALAGNAGRVVVQHWIDQTLEEAVNHFKNWWEDLQITNLYKKSTSSRKEPSKKRGDSELSDSPLAIINLARATLRQSKEQKTDKLISERVIQLYRAALEGTSLPISLLKPILDEFYSALVKNDEKKQMYPFSQSRFALVKLILTRNRKEDQFMPTYELAETHDPAYNLGMLLAVFENLQDKYHNYEKKGPGIVERYYGTASSAPASTFPILCRLARHHLSKVRREDEAAYYGIEKRIIEIMSKFQSSSLSMPPAFPRILSLEDQGRFALGFYQQKAYRPPKGTNTESIGTETEETLYKDMRKEINNE